MAPVAGYYLKKQLFHQFSSMKSGKTEFFNHNIIKFSDNDNINSCNHGHKFDSVINSADKNVILEDLANLKMVKDNGGNTFIEKSNKNAADISWVNMCPTGEKIVDAEMHKIFIDSMEIDVFANDSARGTSTPISANNSQQQVDSSEQYFLPCRKMYFFGSFSLQ